MITEVSIIIPTLNEEKYLPKLLQSLADQEFTGKFEVIVADCHSEDRTYEIAQSFKDKIDELTVIQTARGISHQRNEGAKRAKYAFLLFLDADVVLPPHFLKRYVNERPYSDTNFIDFPLHLPDQFNLSDYILAYCVFGYIALVQRKKPIVFGSSLFTSRANHEKIGGFREDRVLWEDVEYSELLMKNGANYHLRWHPAVLLSPRRVRRHGRIRTVLFGLKSYAYIKKFGYEYDKKRFDKFGYTFGDHE
jgi:glycosyltransferase involved in cell wall biosynthesis